MSTPPPPNQPYPPQPQPHQPPFPPQQPPLRPQFQPSPPSTPPAPAKKRGPWITSKPMIGVGALILGLILGTNSAGGSAEPAATVTVTGSAGATITQQVTTTATVATTVTAQPAPPPPPAGTFKDGMWLVNKDIKPGQYRSDNASGRCYWERLKDTAGTLDSIIANDNVKGPALVTIKPTDVAFKSSSCGEWRPV